jgi:hypothetical protein
MPADWVRRRELEDLLKGSYLPAAGTIHEHRQQADAVRRQRKDESVTT